MTRGSAGLVRFDVRSELLGEPLPVLGDQDLDHQPAVLQHGATERDAARLSARGHDQVADVELVVALEDRRLAGVGPERLELLLQPERPRQVQLATAVDGQLDLAALDLGDGDVEVDVAVPAEPGQYRPGLGALDGPGSSRSGSMGPSSTSSRDRQECRSE